jgi:hypothetical protein
MSFFAGYSRFDDLRTCRAAQDFARASRGQSALKDHKSVRLTQPGGENAGHGSPKSRPPLLEGPEARQGSSARMGCGGRNGMWHSERARPLGDQQHSMPVSKSGDAGSRLRFSFPSFGSTGNIRSKLVSDS